jgi:hypothetical protein
MENFKREDTYGAVLSKTDKNLCLGTDSPFHRITVTVHLVHRQLHWKVMVEIEYVEQKFLTIFVVLKYFLFKL